jgi:hypothetical protein
MVILTGKAAAAWQYRVILRIRPLAPSFMAIVTTSVFCGRTNSSRQTSRLQIGTQFRHRKEPTPMSD